MSDLAAPPNNPRWAALLRSYDQVLLKKDLFKPVNRHIHAYVPTGLPIRKLDLLEEEL